MHLLTQVLFSYPFLGGKLGGKHNENTNNIKALEI